ncbi:hypothetical protein [Azohydromonas australica]|uniref:hypothetical protein n=1 Tax=Azohydromonas australica TaxID=364039 RepID=UPI0012EBB2D7|nr:hypothetical protein [Azohydromonas australica]
MEITVAQVDDLRLKLREMPAQEETKQKLTLQQAIARMADELTELQRRGYSMDDIANILRGTGLEISPQSLKSYLSRSRNTTKQRRGRSNAAATRSNAAATRSKKASGKEPSRGQAVTCGQGASEHAIGHAPVTHAPSPIDERLEGLPGDESRNSHTDSTSGRPGNDMSDSAVDTRVDRDVDGPVDSEVDGRVDRAVERRVETLRDGSVNGAGNLRGAVQKDGSGGASGDSAGERLQNRADSPAVSSTRDQPQAAHRSSSFVPRADSPVI